MVSPRKNLDVIFDKNIVNKDVSTFLLTDDFSEEGLIKIKSNSSIKDKSNKSKKNYKKINKDSIKDSIKDSVKDKKSKEEKSGRNSNVEFIIREDTETDEKKLIINLQLKLDESLVGNELLKIDFEINKEIYLELIKELLK